MDNTETIKRRLLDLAGQAYSRQIYTNSHFLSLSEQEIFLSIKNEFPPVKAELFSPLPSSIRKLAVFGSEEEFGYVWAPPLRVIHIEPLSVKFAEELSHRDYLGSVMALGIEREMTGDIVIRNKEAWLFALDPAADYIAESLTSVRHTSVKCSFVPGDVPDIKPAFRTDRFNIASERTDLIISAATGLNRDKAKKLLDDEKVFINGRTVRSAGHRLSPGDEMVIRGFGKYIYDGIETSTRKGRLNVILRKYI